jgi:hypothetical protein
MLLLPLLLILTSCQQNTANDTQWSQETLSTRALAETETKAEVRLVKESKHTRTLEETFSNLQNGTGGQRLDQLLPDKPFEEAFGSVKEDALATYIKKHVDQLFLEDTFVGVELNQGFRRLPVSEQVVHRSLAFKGQEVQYVFQDEKIKSSSLRGALVTIPRHIEPHEEAWLLAMLVGEVRKQELPKQKPPTGKPGKIHTEPPRDVFQKGEHYYTLLASLALIENQSKTALSEAAKAYLLREAEPLLEKLHPETPHLSSWTHLLAFERKQAASFKIPPPKYPLRLIDLLLSRLTHLSEKGDLDALYPETKPYQKLIGAKTAPELKKRLEKDIRRLSPEHHLPPTDVRFLRKGELAENVNTLDALFVESRKMTATYGVGETEPVQALPMKPAVIRYFHAFKGLTPMFQLATLLHEVRHADCEIPPDKDDLELLRAYYANQTADGVFEQKWRAHECSYLHTFCHGGAFHGVQMCDPAPWGAYMTSVVFMAAHIPPSKTEAGSHAWEYLEHLALIESIQRFAYMPPHLKRPHPGSIETFIHPIFKGQYGAPKGPS